MSLHSSNKSVKYDSSTSSKQSKFNEYYDGKKELHNLGAGEMFYIPDFIKSRKQKDMMYQKLLNEIQFKQMFNLTPSSDKVETLPRLLIAQTDKSDDHKSPVYRMPACNEKNIPTDNWTPTVREIVELANHETGQEFNHCRACDQTMESQETYHRISHTDMDLKSPCMHPPLVNPL